jgi:outer membrane protein TolC
MNCRIVFFLLVSCSVFESYSQSQITADIVSLSELAYYKSPIIERNTLTVNNAEGNLLIQKSTFDYLLSSDVSLSRNSLNLFDDDPRNQFLDGEFNSNSASASLGLSKTFRSSLTASLSVDYTLANDNFPIDRFNQNVGSNIDNHTVTSTFLLTQPLLRGRGRSIATIFEEVGSLNLESTSSNLVFANSFELLQTALSYWEYLSAYNSLIIFKENEARVKKMLEITKRLVDADKKPSGDLSQIQADVANQERQTSQAEQTLYNTRLNLGRTIGLSEEDSKNIGPPISDFPSILETGYTITINISKLQNIALNNREDIQAVKKIEQAAELQLKSAKNNLKPNLDLSGFINYGGMNMGNGFNRAISAFSNTQGRNLGFGLRLNFTFPLNNNLARGSYIQNEALLKDQQIVNENLERNININVSQALNNLDNSVVIFEKAKESLDFYKEVYENEQVKFRNGLTTLLNLILFQERLTFAQLDYLQAKQLFASSIINLRYETGTLIKSQNKTNQNIKNIRREIFYTIPINN